MDLFSVKKGKATKIMNIILLLWFIGALVMSFGLLVNLLIPAEGQSYGNISDLRSFIISLGNACIVGVVLWLINKKKEGE